jgi:hypothetical protein
MSVTLRAPKTKKRARARMHFLLIPIRILQSPAALAFI